MLFDLKSIASIFQKQTLKHQEGRNERFLISCKCNQGQACLSRSNVNVHHFCKILKQKSNLDLSRFVQEN